MQEQLHRLASEQRLWVRRNGKTVDVDFGGLLAFHQGDSWWGCAVGFRTLQRAATLLDEAGVLDADSLEVVSGHPGPGVRDAFEYATGCVSAARFRLLEPAGPTACAPDMRYEWWLSANGRSVHVQLRDGFVPPEFRTLLGRLGTDRERDEDRALFERYKRALSERLWSEPLQRTLHAERVAPVAVPEAQTHA